MIQAFCECNTAESSEEVFKIKFLLLSLGSSGRDFKDQTSCLMIL